VTLLVRLFKLSLPAASGASGKIYVIRKTDSSNNELTFSALILVDGSTVTLNYPKHYECNLMVVLGMLLTNFSDLY
jgi:hypothetical protein